MWKRAIAIGWKGGFGRTVSIEIIFHGNQLKSFSRLHLNKISNSGEKKRNKELFQGEDISDKKA